MEHAYYVVNSNGAFNEGRVVLLDDVKPDEARLINSGYFAQLINPRLDEHGRVQDQD